MFPFPSFFGALAALKISITCFICIFQISPSVYLSMVWIRSLFSLRYRAFARLLAPDGEKADHAMYSIGIQKPFGDSGELLGVIKVKDASVMSSGVYERYFRTNDRLYHHILDTGTGYPAENDLTQVTIISPYSADGELHFTSGFGDELTFE